VKALPRDVEASPEVFLRAEHAEHGIRCGIADGDLIVWGKAAVNVKEK